MQVNEVVKFLKLNKFSVIAAHAATHDTDAQVVVTENISIQVGNGYMMVVRSEGDGSNQEWHFYPERRSMPAILGCDLPQAMRAMSAPRVLAPNTARRVFPRVSAALCQP